MTVFSNSVMTEVDRTAIQMGKDAFKALYRDRVRFDERRKIELANATVDHMELGLPALTADQKVIFVIRWLQGFDEALRDHNRRVALNKMARIMAQNAPTNAYKGAGLPKKRSAAGSAVRKQERRAWAR